MRRFGSTRIAALLSFQDLYVGLSPYSAPGVFSLLAAAELTEGVWYPIGGFSKVGATGVCTVICVCVCALEGLGGQRSVAQCW